MRATLQRFLLFLAAATDRDLARAIEQFKSEDRRMRSKLSPIEAPFKVRRGKVLISYE
jgi:hypothetical protein